ncbi:MAG: SNF2-related protein [Saprospiraceae bacterium]|nr:DEAD/DEAH box helicase family protein [Lewinella sp.]
MRKSYGATWWGKQWLNALNNIDYSNRLPRGRSYANKGAVRQIEIDGNRISAKVAGSRPTPYKVNITIPVFTAHTKARIIELVTENPILLSHLLNRELPNQLYESCREQGIDLFPATWRDLEGRCSCPDWAVPCKHLAAVLYLIANEIDKNPFMVFELHGFDLFQGLAGIGYTTEDEREVHIQPIEKLRHSFRSVSQHFIWDQQLFADLDFSKVPDCLEQLLTLLPEETVFYPSGHFKSILEKAYKSVSKNIAGHLKKTEPELTTMMDAVEDVELMLDEEMDFLTCQFRDIRGKTVLSFDKLQELTRWLDQVPVSRTESLAPTLRGLLLTYHLAERLAMHNAYIPQLLRVGSKRYKVRWLPAILNTGVESICKRVEQLVPKDLLFYKIGEEIEIPAPEDYFRTFISVFLSHFVELHYQLDYRFQADSVIRLFFNGSLEIFDDFEKREYPPAIQLWLNRFYITDKSHVPIIQVEDHDGIFTVSIGVEDRSQPLEVPISLNDLFTKEEYRAIRMSVLRDMALLADHFPQANQLLSSQGTGHLTFDSEAFVEILFKILPSIRLFGIKVLLPKALRKLIRPQVSMLMEGADDGVVSQSGIISLENMLRFQWQIAMGDQMVGPEEFLQYVQQYSGIVKLQDQYVYFNEKEIRNLIDKLENPPVLDAHQLLQVALTEEYEGAKIRLDPKAQQIMKDLLDSEGIVPPAGLQATLRPYQERGYAWLYKNARLGFGSLIADDMGLGKTLQVITTLLKLKEDGELKKQKGLIIVPTTLLTNWAKEIAKFAPELNTHIYHGPNRTLAPLKEVDLLITTYGLVRSEAAKLQKQKWLTVIIDEAQNIKNPATAQTKAVKKIKAPVRIAMSGTPVENRLSEYWSIFDFSNSGYLGNLKKFKDNYAKPIEIDRDQERLQHFRQITDPFILRRVKSDKNIIQDLPDKIEKDQFCTLTPEQAALYQNVVDQNLKAVSETEEHIQRQGLIFKLMTALKQVCNHPAHFLKKGDEKPELSGKSQLMMSLLQQILDNEEKALIFTQYQEMGKMLARMIESEFGFEPPFLHGGVSRKMRDEMVEDFQNNRTTRIMLLSLKAGGTGLNLTAASNVIHYDLWWNPAVEAQATDRAYRIGQSRNVMVHRFITQGTFEEKINKLLQSKKELADLTVSSGEKWVGDLSNEELRELITLG